MTMYLYRKTMQAVTLATAILVFSFALQAQYRAPQAERKTPRAVGVLETFKNGSRRLVPVSFFYEKHYYDATFYHATPVPFTLYSETVYEVQQVGKPLGTFTVQSATQNSATWFGNGRFKLAPDAAALAKKNAPAPVVVEDNSRPVLHRHEGSEGDTPPAHPEPAAGTAEEDPDRPKLHRREGAEGTSTDASAAPAATAPAKAPADQSAESSGQDPERPKLHRKDDSTERTTPATTAKSVSIQTATPGAAAPAALTPNDDPEHPVLRRGKPVQAQGGRDLPDFKREEPVSRQVAISDAGPSEAQPLIYVCSEGERKQMELSARELAGSELRRLAAQRGISLPASAKSGVTKSAVAKSAASNPTKGKAAGPALTLPAMPFAEEQFVPYDLDYNNYATVVFSARYTPDRPIEQGAGAQGKSWVVTVVARQEEGKLVKLYSSVSDPRELDLYPEVRLVDAVDPDGYGRSALLFREKKRDGVSWLLKRATGYELQTIFETSSH